eukprot:363184-Chlamydomonas_euryale.AAC.2
MQATGCSYTLLTAHHVLACKRQACALTAHWFYYLDIIIIVVVYVPCMCVAGWYIESDPDAPWKTRLNDLIFIAILETLVAGSALLYCMFLMPVRLSRVVCHGLRGNGNA